MIIIAYTTEKGILSTIQLPDCCWHITVLITKWIRLYVTIYI